ncbi:hypothetical protein M427DRAFT_441578 [Gonapodya prolifera JEL478]|uniref:Uncharacterized protein n=1 Tax=Gonapodya prolifera (strain JEL478) TaxID=1344416 RepID=A0A139A4A3_GONPJ|nr:hypothetical protein M427DRAFT_441578 [Gonapodya prolifera JEL478]|eukprot:KXS11305.1 hypothetical protein M427DRAFT_441578 [Gonapodya prolifera JEL478]
MSGPWRRTARTSSNPKWSRSFFNLVPEAQDMAFDGCTPLQVLAGLCEHKLLGPIFEAQGVAAAAGHPSGIAPNAVPAEFLKCAVGLHRREEVGWVLGAPPNQTTRGGVSESERRSSVTPSPPPDADDLAASWPFYPTMVDLEPVVKPPRDPVFFPPTTSFVNGAYPPSPNSVLGSSPGTLAPPPHIPGSPLVSSGSVNPARFHPPRSRVDGRRRCTRT